MALYENVDRVPNVMTLTGDRDRGDDGWNQGLWIFALVIIFVILALIWSRREPHEERRHGSEIGEILPAIAAMQMANSQPRHDNYTNWPGDFMNYDFAKFAKLESHDEHWDMYGQQLKSDSDIRYEAAKNDWELSRQIGETKYDTLKQSYETSRQIDGVQYNLSREHYSQYRDLERGQDAIKAEVARQVEALRAEMNRNRIADLERQLTVAQLKDHTGDSYPYRPAYVCEPAPYC